MTMHTPIALRLALRPHLHPSPQKAANRCHGLPPRAACDRPTLVTTPAQAVHVDASLPGVNARLLTGFWWPLRPAMCSSRPPAAMSHTAQTHKKEHRQQGARVLHCCLLVPVCSQVTCVFVFATQCLPAAVRDWLLLLVVVLCSQRACCAAHGSCQPATQQAEHTTAVPARLALTPATVPSIAPAASSCLSWLNATDSTKRSFLLPVAPSACVFVEGGKWSGGWVAAGRVVMLRGCVCLCSCIHVLRHCLP